MPVNAPALCCLHCGAALEPCAGRPLLCTACGTTYPLSDDIPSLIAHAGSDDTVKRFFDEVAQVIEGSNAGYVPFKDGKRDMQLRIFSRAFQRALGRWAAPGSAVLDVGCGHGALLEPIVRDYDMTGVDFAMDMLPAARDRGYRVYHADAAALPFTSDQFDGVLCAEVLQHVSDPRPILAELVRVCRPGGSVIVSTLNRYSLVRLAGRIFSRVLRPQQLNVPILRRAPAQLVRAAADLPVKLRGVAWVCSPSSAVAFTRSPHAAAAPFATNFILCWTKEA